MKSGVARRILFLVDRRALAAQAVLAFASFEPEPGLKFINIYEVYSQRFQREDFDEDQKFDPKVLPSSYLTDPQPGHAFVYVSTIQRMTINLFGRDAIFAAGDEELDEDATKLDIPIHAFDLVIADECHRGYTSSEAAVWRKTLDHFDATKIGLTATPAAHTTAYFKDIVYRYEYDRAVREGYLVDYDVVAVKSNVRMSGVFLKEGEQVGVVNRVHNNLTCWKTNANSIPLRWNGTLPHLTLTRKFCGRLRSGPRSTKSNTGDSRRYLSSQPMTCHTHRTPTSW
jgi:type I restriction enzyme R subunit